MIICVLALLPVPGMTVGSVDCEQLSEYSDTFLEEELSADKLSTYIERVREFRACVGSSDSVMFAHSYQLEAAALTYAHRFSDVIEFADSLADVFPADRFPTVLGYIAENKAYAAFRLGRLPVSVSEYLKAADYMPAERVDLRVRLLLHAGIALERMGDYARARELYDRAYEVASDSLSESEVQRRSVWLAQVLYRLGMSESRLVRSRKDSTGIPDIGVPLELFSRSNEIFAELGRRSSLGFGLIEIGRLYSHAGDLDLASERLRVAIGIGEEIGDLHLQAEGRYVYGRELTDAGAPQSAREQLVQAFRDVQADAYSRPGLERDILHVLGSIHEREGRLDSASYYYGEAIERAERQRENLGVSDWSPVAFSEWQRPYEGQVRVLVSMGRYEEAFLALERGRARYLTDLRRFNRLRVELDPETAHQLRAIEHELEELRTRLGADALDTADVRDIRLHEAYLSGRREDLVHFRNHDPVATLDVLQESLARRQQVLVSYFITSDTDTDNQPLSTAFVVTPDSLVVIRLDVTLENLAERLSALGVFVSGSPGNEGYGFAQTQVDLDLLHDLYRLLFADVSERIPENMAVVIVPSIELASVPFGALVTEPSGRFDYGVAKYLIERHPLTYELAASLVTEGPRDEHFGLDVFAVGLESFGNRSPDLPRRSLSIDGAALADLPFVREEMTCLERLTDLRVSVLNEEATPSTFLDHVSAARIVHVATHSIVNPHSPYLNYIQLQPERPEGDQSSGSLYMHQLSSRYVPARLVVLSACGTAVGTGVGGEGVVSIQYALRAAGADALLATLWQVDDRAMVALMCSFYNNLSAGDRKDVALQKAKIEYLKRTDGGYASPFFWAAPALFGNPEPVPVGPPAARAWKVWGAAGLVLLLLFSIALRLVLTRIR